MIQLDQNSQQFCDEVINLVRGLGVNFVWLRTWRDIPTADIEPEHLKDRLKLLYGETLHSPREKIQDLLDFYCLLAEVRQLHDQFCIPRRSVREIGKSIGLTKNGVYARLKKLGLTPEQVANPKLSILDLAKLSTTLSEMARKIETVMQSGQEEEIPLPDLSYLEFL